MFGHDVSQTISFLDNHEPRDTQFGLFPSVLNRSDGCSLDGIQAEVRKGLVDDFIQSCMSVVLILAPPAAKGMSTQYVHTGSTVMV